MSFIGIIADNKSESNLNNLVINNNSLGNNNLIFIKDSNVDNIKNVKFDLIVINKKIEIDESLIKILKNAKYIGINSDIELNLDILPNLQANIITYGFNSKATITISSVTEENVLICIQRSIYNSYGEIELQEIKLNKKNRYSVYDIMMFLIIYLIYVPEEVGKIVI